MALTPGTRLGVYEIVALLGSGGRSEVYRARDTRLARDVAIIVFPAASTASPEQLRRFEQEAHAAAALNHPNILAVYDVGQHDGAPYIVSELLEGDVLRAHMKRPRSLRKALVYAVQMAQGLAAAHDQGIVHRDLKPESVFVTPDGHVKLLDFGVAFLAEPAQALDFVAGSPTPLVRVSPRLETAAGVIADTVGYMAPEQIRDTTVDHRADLFAFGTVLYEMLAGRRPFEGESAVEVMNAILKDDPAEFPAGVSPAAERLVRHCLEKEPSERFQSARDLLSELERLGSASGDRPPSSRTGRRRRRSWWRLSPAAAAATRPQSARDLTFERLGSASGDRPPSSRTGRRRRRSWWQLSPGVAVSTQSQSARDLPSERPGPAPGATATGDGSRAGHRRHRSWWRLSPGAAAIVAAIAAAVGIGVDRFATERDDYSTKPALFERLTYERGMLRAARFTDDAGTVVYSAAWDGPQLHLYMTRPQATTSKLLDVPAAQLFSVSRSGELAVSLDHAFDGWVGSGTLARVPLTGGEARPVLKDVREAEWAPDGNTLAVVRRVNGRDQLEWPIGKVLYRTSGYLTTPRFSADGQRLAFGDHPIFGADDGDIDVIDAKGQRQAIATNLIGIRGVAWSPRGDEVWFSAAVDDAQSFAGLQAVNLSGRRRTLLTSAVDLALMDVEQNGRVLVSGETRLRHIDALLPGDTAARDFSLFDASVARTISDGGRQLLITRQGPTSVYLRRTDQGDAVRLGEGEGFDLSRDGQWALSVIVAPPSRVALLPTGAGIPQELPNSQRLTIAGAKLFPDGQHVVLLGGKPGEPWRGYIQNVSDGAIRAFTAPGVSYLPSRAIAVSNDGRYVALTDKAGRTRLFPVDGGEPQPIPGAADDEYPLTWAPDGRSVFLTRGTSPPWRIDRLDLATGARTLWKAVTASQNAGIRLSQLAMSPDGEAYVHSYSQLLSNLYVVYGVR